MWVTRLLTVSLILVLLPATAWSHCEIPCGIYGDAMRFQSLRENIKTIEKSMSKIVELSKDSGKNINQLVRWVNNKETHANNIRHIVTQYFMAQRIKPNKPNAKAYAARLAMLHQMIVASMKCKQTTSQAHTTTLRTLVGNFEKAYLGKQGKLHLHEHHGKKLAAAKTPQEAFERFTKALSTADGEGVHALMAKVDRIAFGKMHARLKTGLAAGQAEALAELKGLGVEPQAFAKMTLVQWLSKRFARMPAEVRKQFAEAKLTDLKVEGKVASGRISMPGKPRSEMFWAVLEDGAWRIARAKPGS